jgi:hypothetical protein
VTIFYSVPMDSSGRHDDGDEKETFTCSQCGFREGYHYKGTNPPFKRTVLLKEDSYVMKDPFAPRGDGLFVVLGSDCCSCAQPVCQDSACGVFYKRRYCLPCFNAGQGSFPADLVARVKAAEGK